MLQGQSPHLSLLVSQSPNLSHFCSKVSSCFHAKGNVETSAPNNLKMTLNTKRPKVSHIHVKTTLESQIAVCFTLRLAIVELQAILRQVRQMIPNDQMTLNAKSSKVTDINM